MAEITIRSDLARRLELIAQEENRSLEDVLADLIALYEARLSGSGDAFEAMIGMFDDDITDLSTTVRETMTDYYRQKHGRSD